jgi:hypothetical protein
VSVLQDLRFGIRLLAKDRWQTIASVFALTVGIGMNAMVFTLVNAFLIRSLPFADPDRIMYVGERDRVSGRNFMVSWPDFQDWRAAQTSFVGLAAWSAGTFNVSDAGQPAERYYGAYFSANAFAVLGERPILGRDFGPDDDRTGAAHVVMLGEGIWRSRYGADPSIVGANDSRQRRAGDRRRRDASDDEVPGCGSVAAGGGVARPRRPPAHRSLWPPGVRSTGRRRDA